MSKTRPALIVNDDTVGVLPLKIVVPITAWRAAYARFPWMVRLNPDAINRLDKPSAADTFQVRSVAVQRFIREIGEVSPTFLSSVEWSLRLVLSMKP
jgi:mRNA interferase MazF